MDYCSAGTKHIAKNNSKLDFDYLRTSTGWVLHDVYRRVGLLVPQSLHQNHSLYLLVAQFANTAEVVSQPDHSDYYSNQHQTQYTSARLLHHPTQ